MRSLRNLFSHSIVVVGLLAVVCAGTLLATSRVLQRTTSEVAASVESVRLVEEAELGLLLHARAGDPLVRRDFESDIRQAIDGAKRFVTSDNEQRVLERAEAALAAYLAASEQRDARQTANAESVAYAALEDLVAINLDHTRIAHQHALEWETIANIVGIALAVAVIAITVLLILWLRRRVIDPLFSLADTVRRFGAGERAVRAVETGPIEVRDMSRRFNEMADAIASQREAQVAFLGGVAHDLRTPLSALGLAVDALSPSEPLPEEPQLRRTIEMIARQIHHLERMLGDFVDMSSIERDKLSLQVADHDVRDIVRAAVAIFSPVARGRLRLDLPAEPCVVACDEVRIGQAVTNLVSNAIKYSPVDAPIDVRVRRDGSDVVIEVTDRGKGIPTEDHQRIFEPFRRIGPQVAAGAGLGLFNVKRIVQAHGGRVEVDSDPLRGTTFRIRLAAATAQATRSQLPTASLSREGES